MPLSEESQKEPPTVINLIHAADVKQEIGTGGFGDVNMTAADAINVDEDEARIDALIEKFRAQEHPNID